jgi:hypothetical protein
VGRGVWAGLGFEMGVAVAVAVAWNWTGLGLSSKGNVSWTDEMDWGSEEMVRWARMYLVVGQSRMVYD